MNVRKMKFIYYIYIIVNKSVGVHLKEVIHDYLLFYNI